VECSTFGKGAASRGGCGVVSRSNYSARKAARLRGEPVTSRSHEPAPWYTFTLHARGNEDGRVRLERELREFGERDRKRRLERAERRALFRMLAEEGLIEQVEPLDEPTT
jgi:hypothetical protein